MITKDISGKLAVGIRGYALMEIKETLSLESVDQSSNIDANLVVYDIEEWGIEDWVRHAFDDMPKDAGVYCFSGKAVFTEDDSDYPVMKLTPSQPTN